MAIDSDLGSTAIPLYSFWAIGSGAPYALGASTLITRDFIKEGGICEAVNAAMEYDPGCGGVVCFQEYPKMPKK